MTLKGDGLVVKVGEIDTYVTVKGSGEPLVYLHGAFGYGSWHPFLDKLSENFTVYAPLHPGFDEGEGLEHLTDLLDLTLYHIDLLESLGLEKPHVAGHYNGAMVAAEMAALCPHSVGRLVLASPAGVWQDDNQGTDYFAVPPGELAKVLFSDSSSEIVKLAIPETTNELEVEIEDIRRVRALSTVGKFLWPIPDKGLRKRMGRIKSQVMVVMGSDDPIVPLEYGQDFLAGISGSKLSVLDGASHMLMLEKPDEFSSIIVEFLSN